MTLTQEHQSRLARKRTTFAQIEPELARAAALTLCDTAARVRAPIEDTKVVFSAVFGGRDLLPVKEAA